MSTSTPDLGALSFIVSTFPTAMPDRGPALGNMERVTWDSLSHTITDKRRVGQKDGPNIVLARFKPEPDGRARRVKANVLTRTGIALDCETDKKTGEIPPDPAFVVERLRAKGWAAVLYTSHSHTSDAPRYRVVLPISDELPPLLPAPEVVADALGLSGVLDRSKLGASSVFYLPSAAPGSTTNHHAVMVDGAPIDAAWMREHAGKILEAREAAQAALRAEVMRDAETRRQAKIKAAGAKGIKPTDQLIESIRDRLDLVGELTRHGYEKKGDRYLYAGSETGIPGVHILVGNDGVERVFSHHSGDPLAAENLPSWCMVKAVDVVDLVTILDFGGNQRKALHELAKRFQIGEPLKAKAPPPEPDGFSDVPPAENEDVGQPASKDQGDADDAPASLPDCYTMNASGLWFSPPAKGDDEQPAATWISAPFSIVAETKDEAGGSWGLLLRWQDRDAQQHTWAMPRKLLHADGNAIASELEDAGLSVGTGKRPHDLLKSLLSQVKTRRRMRCVNRSGWHQTERGLVYVMPGGDAFGPGASNVILQSEKATVGGGELQTRGTLQEWQDHVAKMAVGNDRVALFIAASLAAPLLYVATEPSGGIHLYGKSQDGKTTTLAAASSVWGKGDSSGHIRSWRATANGFEGIASETCDSLLPLDEIGQADAREVGEVVYLLANEAGKGRAARDGSARARRTWRTLFLSTGEVPLATKMQERGNVRPQAGQDIRLVSLPANAGGKYGVFQNLHGHTSAVAFATHLREASRSYYGEAARVFLDGVAYDLAENPGRMATHIAKVRDDFVRLCVPKGSDGQVSSVARRFALVAAAGELAIAFAVLPWPEGEAFRAAKAGFLAWLDNRGGTAAGEDVAAIAAVRRFIELHGESRFTTIYPNNDTQRVSAEEVPDEVASGGRTTVNRVGFRRRGADGWEYLILPEAWKDEVCKGFDPARAANVLKDAGLLTPGEGAHLAPKVLIAGYSRMRLYLIKGAILGPAGE